MAANLVYQEQVIASEEDLVSLLESSPTEGYTYLITNDFNHTYDPDLPTEQTVSYYVGQCVFWDGTIFRPLAIGDMNVMYRRFQTWALNWFRETVEDASIFFESFFGRGTNSIAANAVKDDEMFQITKDGGNLHMDQSGTILLTSKYSQFKVNLEINFPNNSNNNNYVQFTVKARTIQNNQASTVTNITQVATLDTTIPTHHITFNYDLHDKKSVQFRFSTSDGVATAWNFSSNISVLGYIIGKDETPTGGN